MSPDVLFKPTGNKFRDFFMKIVENKWFDRFIFLCIILNTVTLSIKWFDQS